MATSNTVLNDKLRAKYLPLISEALAALGEEVLQTKNNEIAFPVVDEDGNEKFVTVTIKVPKGDRSGEPYDGYGEADSYRMHIAEQAEKKAKEYLSDHVSKCVVKSKTAVKGQIELNLEVRLKDDNTDFINALAQLAGVESAVLVSYNGDYLG